VRQPRTHIIILIAGALSACSMGNNPFTAFVDPGKYQYVTCEQINANLKAWSAKEQELKMLMAKAEQGAGGAVVNMLAYKGDYVAANEELQVLNIAARAKNCEDPANWTSNFAVR
jgi:myo-inositol-hexaphosphate 3-phosphohydrolase